VLRAMRRPAAEAKTLERIASWRRQVPELTLRSSFVVGFPGETEEDFQHLLDWLEEAALDRVGCFRYEPVTGAAANALPGAVAPEVTEERWHRFMAAQQAISAKRLQAKVGGTIAIIVDASDNDGIVARSTGDAPEIDGKVFLPADAAIRPGDQLEAVVESAGDYDLWARPTVARDSRRRGPGAG
jgi:ribosomal protein S12 methylthiotransferase